MVAATAQAADYFVDSFANNSAGWTFGTGWAIGSATASSGHSHLDPDPASDNTATSDNGIAGYAIGGNTGTALFSARYLTSPVINTQGSGSLILEFYRWLNSDYPNYMSSTIEVWNGTSWVQIFLATSDPVIQDTAWTKVQYDVSAYRNANFRVRFSVAVTGTSVWNVSSWNIDDLRIYGDPAPTSTTTTATSDSATGATLYGSVNPNSATTNAFFQYSKVADLSSGVTTTTGHAIGSGTGAVQISQVVSGLQPHTTYYYRVVGTNSTVTSNGSILNFTTGNTHPVAGAGTGAVTTGETALVTLPFTTPDADGDTVTISGSPSASGGAPFTLGSVTGNQVQVTGRSNAVGQGTISYTVSDGFGGTAQGSVTVTVTDNDAPSVTVPENMVAEALSSLGRIVTFTPSASDAVGVVSLTSTPASGSVFPIGVTEVLVTALDAAGNTRSQSFNVTVRDTTAPAVTVPENITVEAAGMSGRVVTFIPSASDLVGVVSLTSTPASGSLFPIGQTQVQVTAVDAAGNSASQSFTVTVGDSIAPVVTVPGNIGPVEATGPSGAVVTYTVQVTDTVGVKSITYSRASGQFFPVGTTTVTVTATDPAGNIGSAGFTVTVRDTTPPVITPPANVESFATSESGRTLIFNTGWAVDLVDGSVGVTYSPSSGTEFPIGRTLVTVRAEDAAHNASTATFVVTISPLTDNVAPVVKLTSPSSNPTGSPITIAGTVKDNYGLDHLRVKLNGAPVQLDAPLEKPLSVDFPRNVEKAWSVSGVVPENGFNFIEVEARDIRGLVTTVTKSFTLWRQRPGLAGVYPALVKPEGTPGVATSGLVTLTVLNTGAFSGKVMVNGAEIPVMGVLSNDGTGMLRGTNGNTDALPLVTVERTLLKKTAATTMRTVTRQHGTLSLQVSEEGGLSGVLTDGVGLEPAVLASFAGKKAPYSKTNTVAASLLNLPADAQGPAKGYYTVALAPGSLEDEADDDGEGIGGGVSFVLPPGPARPPGDGYTTLTLNGTGSALLAGYLADGTSWTASAHLRSDGTLAVFSPLYGKRGGVAGELKFDLDQQNSDVGGNGFLWIRPVQPAALQYVAGWPQGVYLDAAGAKFTGGPAALSLGQGSVNPVLGNVRLVFTDGLLTVTILRRANVDASTGVVTKVPETTPDYTLQVSSSSGVISGSFKHTDGTTVDYRGIVLIKGANRAGFGYFLSNGDGGAGGWFTLEALLPD